MNKRAFSPTGKVQGLENRVIELERQLAEAQEIIRVHNLQAATSALRRSELVFAHSRDIILFIRREDGHILDANAAAEQAYGYSYAELLALSIQDLRAPDTQVMTGDQLVRADSEGILFETVHRRKDGSTFPVEVNSQGATIGDERTLISVIRDITERKQAEAERALLMAAIEQEKIEAQQQAEELYAIIEALHDPVLVYDRDGIIYRSNASAVAAHGFDPSRRHRNETNRAIEVRYPDGRFAPSKDLPSARALKGETVIAEQLEVTNQQGRMLTVLVTSTPLVVNGVQRGAVSVWHDITEQEHAQQALRESETKYRLFFDHLLETVTVFEAVRDDQGEIVDWMFLNVNQAGLQILDLPHDQVEGNSVGQLLGAEVLARYMDDYRQVLETGKPSYHETTYHGKHFRVSVSRMDANRIASVGEDITERKQAEQALQLALSQAEEGRLLLEAMMEYIPEGIAITGGPPDFLIRKVSCYGLELTGDLNRSDLEGVPVGQHQDLLGFFLPDGETRPSPQQTPLYRAAHFGESILNEEMVIHSNEGARIPILINAAPIRDAQGEIVAAINTWRDFTERKRLEEALREARDHADWLARLPGENPNPVARVSAGGIVLYHNPVAAELPGWKCAVGEPLPEPLLPLVERAMALGQPVELDVQLGERFYSVSSMPFPNEGYANLYGRDISERNRAEKALREREETLSAYAEQMARSNQDLQNFAFIASHDLQEPLRKIEAFGSAVLESATQLDDRQRDYLERMRNAAARMRDMVDGLLQLSRVNTQGQAFIRVDLSQVIAEVLSDLEHQVRRTGGRVEAGPLPTIEGDPLQIRQLLQNLIGNALKFQQPDTPPVVKVYARQLDGSVQILVEDNGIGFDPQGTERIFQPFQRLVGRSQYEGSGMGLAICQKIVNRHGGEITARSKPGQGATFIVTLPTGQARSEGDRIDGRK
jgi:PAS domain S-box-containing protein